jgi:hypothetical protein
MQDTLEKENAIQAIRMCESNGLMGTAEALRNILVDLNNMNIVAKRSRQIT